MNWKVSVQVPVEVVVLCSRRSSLTLTVSLVTREFELGLVNRRAKLIELPGGGVEGNWRWTSTTGLL